MNKKHSTLPVGMTPQEIIAALFAKGLNQAAIARGINVTPGAVSRAIYDLSVQSRVMMAIAEALEMDVAQIWPQHFWNKTPKPGRKMVVWHRKAA